MVLSKTSTRKERGVNQEEEKEKEEKKAGRLALQTLNQPLKQESWWNVGDGGVARAQLMWHLKGKLLNQLLLKVASIHFLGTNLTPTEEERKKKEEETTRQQRKKMEGEVQ